MLALQDLPWERPYLGMGGMPGTEASIPLQVQRDALKQVTQIEQSVTAPLEHLELVVQPLHEAARLPLVEVIGDQLQPLVHQLQEGSEAGQSARFHLLAPLPDALHPLRLRARRLKDRGQGLAQLIRLLHARRLLKQAREALLVARLQVFPAL